MQGEADRNVVIRTGFAKIGQPWRHSSGLVKGDVMKTRLTVLVAVAVLGVVVNGSVTYAQINPFGDYWANVARAAQSNDAARVRSLLASDGNPNQADGDSRTALHYAAMNGNLTIIAILIKASARLDVKDKLGNTPLHLAAERNEPDAAQLLLDVGAAVDAENKNGMTPLMMAASQGNIAVVQALLAKGASVTKTDFTGRDAAGWAAESRRPAVVQAIKRAQNAKRS
jgi:ankyrin repeat protein